MGVVSGRMGGDIARLSVDWREDVGVLWGSFVGQRED